MLEKKCRAPEQQVALTAEFENFLVHIYSMALSDNLYRVIEFRKLHMAPDDTEVTVKSVAMHPGRERTSIDYNMEKMPRVESLRFQDRRRKPNHDLS